MYLQKHFTLLHQLFGFFASKDSFLSYSVASPINCFISKFSTNFLIHIYFEWIFSSFSLLYYFSFLSLRYISELLYKHTALQNYLVSFPYHSEKNIAVKSTLFNCYTIINYSKSINSLMSVISKASAILERCSKLITVRVPRTMSLIVDSLIPDISANLF